GSGGGGDEDVAGRQGGVIERGDFARVGKQPLSSRHTVHLDGLGVLVDQQNLVPVLEQLLGDRPADRACAGDGNAHQWPPFPGAAGLANTEANRLRASSFAVTCRKTPCCRTVPGPRRSTSPSPGVNAVPWSGLASTAPTCSPGPP